MTVNPNWPLVVVEANFATGANAAIPRLWDDLTEGRMTGWDCKSGRQFELNVPEAGTMNVRVRNADEALNPYNTGSPFNSGGKALKPFRWLRAWAAWPLTGNLVNAGNDQWVAPYVTGSLADTSGFEGGTLGTWTATAGCTVTSSSVRAHDGSKSMLITWATTAGGIGVAETAAVSVPLHASATYTASAWIWIGSGPAVTLWCNGSHATSTSTTGAWQRVAFTFIADATTLPDLKVYAAATTTSGQQVWVDSVQVEYAGTASAYTTSGPTLYPIHTGYIERYPLTWEKQGYEGWAQLTSVDALALLSRYVLQDVLTQEMLTDGPDFMWPLYDPQASATASNIGKRAVNAGLMVLAPMGAPTTVTTVFGNQATPGLDSLTTLGFTPVTVTDTYVPLCDWYGTTGYTLGGTGAAYTTEFWFSAPPLATPRVMRLARFWGASSEELAVQLTADGHVQMIHKNSAGTPDSTVGTPGTYLDTAWHQVVCTATVTSGTVTETLYVDGQQAGSATRTSAGVPVLRGALLGFDYLAGTYAFSGQMSRLAVYPTALPLTRIQNHWVAGKTGFAGDLTGQRITRILSWAGWKGQAIIPTGATRQGSAVQLSGTTTAAACGLAATTERGAFLALPGGQLALLPRTAWTQQTTSRFVFGEDATGGEAPYVDAQASLDPTYVYNVVKVTRQGGNPMSAYDAQSAADHGVRAAELQTSHLNDADALSMAIWLVAQYKNAQLRVPSVTLNPSANPALWPVVLGAKFGDRVTWKRRTSTGLTVVFDGFIEGITHASQSGSWVTTFQLQPADTIQAGIVGDATYGVIGSSFVPGY